METHKNSGAVGRALGAGESIEDSALAAKAATPRRFPETIAITCQSGMSSGVAASAATANPHTVLQPPTRRHLLTTAAVAGSLAALGGCEKIISRVTEKLGESVPDSVAVPTGVEIDPAHHLLSRAAYGPWPGDVEHVRSVGESAWIEQQLDPKSIDDSLCTLRARRFEELEQAAGECYEYTKPVLREEMARATLLRAVYSKRQLFEVMVSFWTDHLNVNIEKGDCIYLKPYDDRTVIREHALGNFRDLIRASATSAAMLVYLDGKENTFAKMGDIPNENYGRELLELHTLGVHGGYTQKDVYEAARCLTGWRVRAKFRRGTVFFEPTLHDPGEKFVLGQTIPAGGNEQDVERLLDIVCRHPSTARHIATKLVRRFVSEDEPASLVDRVAEVFKTSNGDIKSLVRTVLSSDEFKQSKGAKFKTPFRFVASALRAVGADTHAHQPLIAYLARMGQGVFQYPTPDGYPDKTSPWLGTLMWRWNLAFSLGANKVPSVTVPWDKLLKATGAQGSDGADKLFRYFAGHDPRPMQSLAMASVSADAPGIILASPSFQRY